MKRTRTVFLTLLILLATAGCSYFDDVDEHLNPNASAEIYGATIRQIYHVDHSFGESPEWPLVYVVAATQDQAMFEGPTAPSQALSAELQAAIAAELADESFELRWIENFEEAPYDPAVGVAGGEGIIITLGNIHPQQDGFVQVSFFMTCGGLCGIGKTYVVEWDGDMWQVSGSVGPEVMS